MVNESNLYESIFMDSTEDDYELEMVNQMFHHRNFDEISKYYSIDSYNSFFTAETSMLSIFHVNLRSMRANVDNMIAMFHSLNYQPDIIAISENWLTTSNKDSFNLNGYQSFHVVRTWGLHGGVSVFVRNNISANLISNYSYSNQDIEICSISLKIRDQKFNIAAIYRPRSKRVRVSEFSEIISDILSNDIFAKSNTILIGDFNINLLDHVSHQNTSNYIATIQSLNYLPVICRPTRFPQGNQRGNEALLDHIYVNFTPPSTYGILKYDITDHLPIFINILLPDQSESANYKIKFRMFNENKRQMFTRRLCGVDWEVLLSDDNVDNNYNIFHDTFSQLYNSHFPIVTREVSTKRIKNPWITSGLLTSIKRKSTMYQDYKSGLVTELAYKTYKNRVTSLTRRLKKDYYRRVFSNFKNNTKKLWQTINSLTKPPPPKQQFNSILTENGILNDARHISNANKFFTAVATKLESKLPEAQSDPLSYLQGNFPNSMQIPVISMNDIFREIKTLKVKKCNLDDFSPLIVKENAHILGSPLKLLFNQSIQQGKFPERLKCARVIPIYKKGQKSDMNNYRPISLLNIFSKIFEKVVKTRLVNYMSENNILNANQYGFQKGKSTQDALTAFSKMLYNEIEKSNKVLSIFVDFSKAFDTVPHELLIQKLEFYGIRGILNEWFKDYLSNRSQQTYIDGILSNTNSIPFGVPQGSVLGPILFLIFINDLPHISELFYSILFADDATLSLVGRDTASLLALANSEMHKFYYWCLANRMSINVIKTYYMIFGTQPNDHSIPLLIKSGYNFETIKRIHEIKFLGIHYDQKLDFKTHINYLTQRLSRICALIYRVKELMPTFVLRNMYHAHVSSLINYCNIVWANIYPTALKPLELILKRIIRNISNSDFLAHTAPLFKRLKLLDLEGIRKISLASYFFKTQDVNLPPLLANHGYHTRHRDRLRVPQHRLTQFHNSFLFQAPSFWNVLLTDYPPNIIQSPNLRILKSRLKKFLLS